MSETIREIKLWSNKKYDHSYFDDESGYCVVTDQQEIILKIDDVGCCCEYWGYFLTEDDIDKFIGAELLGVKITDTNRSTTEFTNHSWSFGDDKEDDKVTDPNVTESIELDSGGVLFVDIQTSRGVLQFVAYNAHNGYYGHEATVISKQVEYSTTL